MVFMQNLQSFTFMVQGESTFLLLQADGVLNLYSITDSNAAIRCMVNVSSSVPEGVYSYNLTLYTTNCPMRVASDLAFASYCVYNQSVDIELVSYWIEDANVALAVGLSVGVFFVLVVIGGCVYYHRFYKRNIDALLLKQKSMQATNVEESESGRLAMAQISARRKDTAEELTPKSMSYVLSTSSPIKFLKKKAATKSEVNTFGVTIENENEIDEEERYGYNAKTDKATDRVIQSVRKSKRGEGEVMTPTLGLEEVDYEREDHSKSN